jgi:hypothetical protein
VTKPPNGSDPCGTGKIPLPAYDCGYCHDMIGIGRVTHPKEETEQQD